MSITGSEQWMYSSGREFYDFPIEQSLRFNDNDSAYLSWTPSSTGNRKTWTWSAWVKRSNIGTRQTLFSTGLSGTAYHYWYFETDDTLRYAVHTGGSRYTSAVFRDTSAWMNIIIVHDTTDSTASDRIKIYVNGDRVTSFTQAIDPALNSDGVINSTTYPYNVGRSAFHNSNYYDGYMADINFIDGQALEPTSFGEFKSGIWTPKDTADLTFGTNGFRLEYADGAAIGDDTSGNTNDWTVNNLVASDVVLDSPTNNFPIILDDKGGTSQVYSEGNLHANISSNSYAAKSSMFVPMDSGKWYVEALSDATSGSGAGLGTYTPDSMNTLSISYYFNGNIVLATDMIHYYSSGQIYNAGSSVQSSLTTVGDKDIIGMLIDTDAKTVQFYVNGTASGTAETMANTTDPVAAQLHGHNSRPFMFNFGTDSSFANRKTSGSANATDANGIGDFYYTPPTGAKAICSKNLPTGAIDTAADETPEDYFNTVLYTGNGTSQSITVGFEPSFLWIKNRTQAYSHTLVDSVRDAEGWRYLESNTTNAEGYNNTLVSSLDTDGFSVGSSSTTNHSGNAMVAWNWKAGGSGVSNTDGSITSTVSVGATSEQNWFSVVSYTGNGTGGATVGHGLAVAPDMIIVKSRDNARDWRVYHSSLGATYTLDLNTTNAVQGPNAAYWNSTEPTSSVFSIGSVTTVNGNGEDYISYCFANAENLCRVGKYTGNGSADGTFVFTGHKPSFLLIKETGNANSWELFDTARDPDNVASQRLFPNTSAAEATTNPSLDILSNGFKARAGNTGINRSGGSYIFLSISEQPFKFANAR